MKEEDSVNGFCLPFFKSYFLKHGLIFTVQLSFIFCELYCSLLHVYKLTYMDYQICSPLFVVNLLICSELPFNRLRCTQACVFMYRFLELIAVIRVFTYLITYLHINFTFPLFSHSSLSSLSPFLPPICVLLLCSQRAGFPWISSSHGISSYHMSSHLLSYWGWRRQLSKRKVSQ